MNMFNTVLNGVQAVPGNFVRLIDDPIGWDWEPLEPAEERVLPLDTVRDHAYLDPYTGKKPDVYGGVLPEARSRANESFGIAQMVERGLKGPLDEVKGASNAVSNHSKWAGKDFLHRDRTGNFFFEMEQAAFPEASAEGGWLHSLSQLFDRYDEWWRQTMHGEDSVFRALMPGHWNEDLSKEDKQSIQIWSQTLEAFQCLGKAFSYAISARQNLLSMRAARTELDDYHKRNLKLKNTGQILYNLGLQGDKFALMGVLVMMLMGNWETAAYTLWCGRLAAEVAYLGGILAAGGVNRDATHARDMRELRNKVKLVLDRVNTAEVDAQQVVRSEVGPHRQRVLAPLREGMITYFGERFNYVETKSQIWWRRLRRWTAGKVSWVPGVKSLLEPAAVPADLLANRHIIDRVNDLYDEDVTAVEALASLQESLEELPQDQKEAYEGRMGEELRAMIELAELQATDDESSDDAEEAARHYAEIEAHKRAVFDRANELVGTVEVADPEAEGGVRRELGSLRLKMIEISKLRAPDERTIIESAWDRLMPIKSWRAAPTNGLSKQERHARIVQIHTEIETELASFRTFAAGHISDIHLVAESITGVQSEDTAETLTRKMTPIRDSSNLEVAQVGAANGRLFDSIPKIVQTAAFLGISGYMLISGQGEMAEVCATVKGGLKLPFYVWVPVAGLTATGAILTWRKAKAEFNRARAQAHTKNKYYSMAMLIGETIKVPGNVLIANPVSKPVGVMIYGMGTMVEAGCHVFDNWPKLKKSFRILVYGSAGDYNGNGGSGGNGSGSGSQGEKEK